jgi:hypothetical protein
MVSELEKRRKTGKENFYSFCKIIGKWLELRIIEM